MTKRIARPARAMVLLALLGVLLKTGTGCSGQNPVYSIEIEKVPSPPVGLPATGRLPTLPHAPEPRPTRVQEVFRPGERMYLFIFTSMDIEPVRFSRYAFFNRDAREETETTLPGNLGPFQPGTGFPIAQEAPWEVPWEPGIYEVRVYVKDRIVASARFEVRVD